MSGPQTLFRVVQARRRFLIASDQDADRHLENGTSDGPSRCFPHCEGTDKHPGKMPEGSLDSHALPAFPHTFGQSKTGGAASAVNAQ
jgi:hypothetical protein